MKDYLWQDKRLPFAKTRVKTCPENGKKWLPVFYFATFPSVNFFLPNVKNKLFGCYPVAFLFAMEKDGKTYGM